MTYSSLKAFYSLQLFMCLPLIFQICQGGNGDFRNEQCKKFGEQSIPFINKTDPCKLLCSSPGQEPVKKGLVVDGTSCPSSGVCVDGECVVSYVEILHNMFALVQYIIQPIGCDGVLGSKKTENKCGACSDFCAQLPCKFKDINYNGFIFTQSVSFRVHTDYHTELPSESRNISIALGAPSCDFKGKIIVITICVLSTHSLQLSAALQSLTLLAVATQTFLCQEQCLRLLTIS